ncbi:MAG: DUF3040 domain-containing protein, partial [Terrimesophilobacter sp.]
MPLSEQEQRLLEEMERSLYHNDADFVATVGSQDSRPNYRWIVIGILIGIVGIAGIVTGVATRLPIIGVVGFAVMFTGVLLALRRSTVPTPETEHHDRRTPQRAGFMDRMNERWDKRQDERGH